MRLTFSPIEFIIDSPDGLIKKGRREPAGASSKPLYIRGGARRAASGIEKRRTVVEIYLYKGEKNFQS